MIVDSGSEKVDDNAENDDSSLVSESFNDNKRLVFNGVELNREQKYKIHVSFIGKIDMPTVNKLAQKCLFKRLNPGPVKFDMRFLECKKNILLEGN